jgi:hypothetical protein
MWWRFIAGLIIGGGAGWLFTWLWFKRDKVRAKIAAKVKAGI